MKHLLRVFLLVAIASLCAADGGANSSPGARPSNPNSDKPKASASSDKPSNAPAAVAAAPNSSKQEPIPVLLRGEDLLKKHQENLEERGAHIFATLCFLIVLVVVLSLGAAYMVHQLRQLRASAEDTFSVLASGAGNASGQPQELAQRVDKDRADKKTLDQVFVSVKALAESSGRIERALTALTQRTAESEGQKRELSEAQQKLKALEIARDNAINDLSPAQEEARRLERVRDELQRDLDDLRKVERRAQEDLGRVKSDCETLRSGADGLEKKAEALLREKNSFEAELNAVRGALSSAESELETARLAGQASASQLEASFVQLAPKTLVDPEILTFMRKLHGEALAGSVIATAAWSTLTAFAAADADPQAKDFQLHILKRLGTVLVNYWKGQGSLPKDSHERLTHWARCLNEQAKGRYNLFVPAIGAPVDRTKMTTASSASIVQDVLCWQVRNPAGANYSLAEVA